MLPLDALTAAWVRNQGGACTTASILAALGGLGAQGLPDLAGATLALGARVPYGAPALLDYVSLPGRRAPLDLRAEALAAACGLAVRSHSGFVVPGWRLRPSPGEALVANLAWGQERPGVYGTWGWRPLRPATYSTGGHSVVLAAVADRGWLVVDPNHEGVQHWPRPGLVVTVTRLVRSPAAAE
jgi:hypothetical protein